MDPDTAQVVPKELCEALFAASGAKLVEGRASGLEMDGDACTGVHVDGATVPCDAVVCAMGAWSVLLEDWIGAETGLSVPLEGVYSSSIVFDCAEINQCVGCTPPRYRAGVASMERAVKF